MRSISEVSEPYRSILLKLVSALLKRFKDNLVSVVLFGSVARGEAEPSSDIDLLIIVKDLPKSRFKRQDLFMEVEEDLKPFLSRLEEKQYYVDFSPILKTPEEASKITPLYLDLVEDAIILFDRDNFFRNIMLRLKEKLEKLGAKRVRLGKLWYWVLKKNYKFGEVIEI